MKQQFVPYELALKLKEKDFDKPCMYPFDKYFYMDTSYVEFIDWNEKYKNIDGFCSAPLWQQVIDWLREKHIAIVELPFTNRYGVAHKFKGAEESTFLGGYTKEKAIEHALTLI